MAENEVFDKAPQIKVNRIKKDRVVAEMKYRLSRYVMEALLATGEITIEEAKQVKARMLEKYNPITRCLEEENICQSES